LFDEAGSHAGSFCFGLRQQPLGIGVVAWGCSLQQDVGEIDAGACQQRMGALRRFELLCTPVPLDGFVEIAAAGGETRPEPGDRTTKVDACIEEELSVERLEDRVELGRFVPATETSSEFGERADRSGLGPVAPE
jgi:hypothetical protein